MLQRVQFKRTVRRLLAIGGLSLACSTAPNAAGFALIEQSVPDMGTAYAGSAASDDSVGTLYFNPAGMTRLPGTRAGAAVHLIEPNTEFNNEGTRYVTGAPIRGGNGGDAGDLAALPHFYLTHQIDDKTWFGLAVNAPFGLTTKYKNDWVGRYHAIKSEVKTVNINPSLGLKVNDNLSLALGVSAMYLDGEFTNAMDFGLFTGVPALIGQLDGKSEINGDSWGWGINVGALFEPTEDTRIGLHYRSEVEQNIEGDVDFSGVPNLGSLPAIFVDSDVKADVDLPATFSISGFHQINREWAIVGDYTWTGWSSIPELRFKFASLVPDAVTTFDWKDTSRVALGTIFTPDSSDWTYRVGAAYDESPVKDAASRSARLPDTDRIWLTVGASFDPSRDLRVDFGYAHLFMNDAKIRKTAAPGNEDFSRGSLNGSYDASVDILSIQAEYIF